MKRFEFPLESVQRLRRFHESQARQALQEAIAERDQAEHRLLQTRHRIDEQTRRLAEDLADLNPTEVVYCWLDLDRLEALALKQAEVLAECEIVVHSRTEAYRAARRDREPLDRLEEEMRREHHRQADLVEQTTSDELAIIGYSRKGREP